MTDFIKKLEKEFDTQIIRSKEHIWENYYDIDERWKYYNTYTLDEVDLKDLRYIITNSRQSC